MIIIKINPTMNPEKFYNYNPERSVEQRKEKPAEREISVTFMRHGESSYEDFQNLLKGGCSRNKKLLPDLSEKGIETITNKARKLTEDIDKENEIVVIWTSPELRAIGSGQIIERILAKDGIAIIRNSEISSLSEAHTGIEGKLKMIPQRIHKYFDLSGLTKEQLMSIRMTKDAMDDPDMPFGETWRQYAGEEKFEDIENRNVSKKRFNRIVNSLFLLKKIMKPKDPSKRLRFIFVIHEDLPDNILEFAFNKGLINRKGLGNGEGLDLTIRDKNLVKACHESEEKDLIFDREKREFIKIEEKE